MSHKYIQSLTVLGLFLFCCVAYAEYQSMSKLTGQYDITGKTTLDPPDSESRDTHFRIYLTGEAAQDLYHSMKVAPVEDMCLDDGSLSKLIGNMQCTKLSKEVGYECRFSIDISKQVIDHGWVC